MTFQIGLHLIAVLPAMVLGILIFLKRKGTTSHKFFGRCWVVLMFVSAASSFFIKSNGNFSWIHLLSLASVASISIAIASIRMGKVKMHRGFMIGAYCGAIIAGLFAVIIPGRVVHTFLFSFG